MRRLRMTVLAAFVALCTVVATATPARALDADFIHIQSKDNQSGLCLYPVGAYEGAAVFTGMCRSPSGSYWNFFKRDGYHVIRHNLSGLCLTAPVWNGDYALLYRCGVPEPWDDQLWWVNRLDFGSDEEAPFDAMLHLKSSGVNKCLTAPRWTVPTPRRALVYNCWGKFADQQWRLW
jgi:hypothetical protein